MTIKQALEGMKRARNIAKKASQVDDDEIEIAADDAGATAAVEKMGKALEDNQSGLVR